MTSEHYFHLNSPLLPQIIHINIHPIGIVEHQILGNRRIDNRLKMISQKFRAQLRKVQPIKQQIRKTALPFTHKSIQIEQRDSFSHSDFGAFGGVASHQFVAMIRGPALLCRHISPFGVVNPGRSN